ncbi:MAG: 2-C-methyl-D-erythritol 4-phosphate cytidylyltransferase [Turicibacter sp.]|nr:2-C-methyl-D-erythritol 4-phosphate cytidylyltransferase [Turicibacter sp.]
MYSVIILAAGTGTRMGLGYNKMLYLLGGRPVVVRTVERFKADPSCQEIIVVTNELVEMRRLLSDVKIIPGGKERQDSVYQGLLEVGLPTVLVHDGARPFVTQAMIDECLNVIQKGAAAVVGMPVKDTIKRVATGGEVVETLNREELFAVQTPQGTLTESLRKAHECARSEGFLGTDEATLIEKYLDVPVQIVPGNYSNIKLTTPEDLIFAERLLEVK